jgi:hypothetical protein
MVLFDLWLLTDIVMPFLWRHHVYLELLFQELGHFSNIFSILVAEEISFFVDDKDHYIWFLWSKSTEYFLFAI